MDHIHEAAIQIHQLTKTYRTRVPPKGAAAQVRGLFKPEYREVRAVRGIDLEIPRGEFLAFLGPNGAGKSTTIKMLTGILRPSGGDIRVLGLDPQRQRMQLAFRIGSVFGQKSQLWYHLPASDSFELLGAVYEVEPKVLARRIGELREVFDLGDFIDTPVRKLSLGQRLRCEIAASLIHQPEILFLDEPTIGLDVVVKQEIRTLLSTLNKEHNTTILLTSHDIGDMEKICRRAVIIHHGTIIIDESIKTLKHQTMGKKIVGVRYSRPLDIRVPGLEAVKRTESSARFEVDTRRIPVRDVVGHLTALGPVEDITIEDEPLETLIADIYRSRNEEEGHAALTRPL